MQHDGKIETCHFCGPLFINKNATREQLPQIKYKKISISKYFKKGNATAGSGPPKYTFQRHQPKMHSVWFNYPYNYINTRDNNNDPTNLVNADNEHLPEEPEVEKEEHFDDAYDPT